jgi:hypothetical protein
MGTPGERGPRIQMKGRTFGHLTVVDVAGIDKWGDRFWLCVCSCGKTSEHKGNKLRRGESKSCGCKKPGWCAEANTKHGASARGKMTPEYSTWQWVIDRCENPNNPAFHNYGGRGITIAPEWRHDFEAFRAHLGPRPRGGTIERINNSLGYVPGNVRWATRREQNRNKRSNRWVEALGQRRLMADWARDAGISNATLFRRLEKKWPVEIAVTAPKGARLSDYALSDFAPKADLPATAADFDGAEP